MSADDARVDLQPLPDDPTLADDGALMAECPAYVELARRAAALQADGQFSELAALDVIRRTGPDNQGRPVFMFFPSRLPAGVDLEHVTAFGISLMHDLVARRGKEYTVVWVCNNEVESRLSLGWFRSTYWRTPYAYHKQMRSLCIVHPSVRVRLTLFALSYLTKHSFWEKINYADRLEFLDESVPVALIRSLPQEYKAYDKRLDAEMYDPQAQAAAMAMAGLPGGAMGAMGADGAMGVPGAGAAAADPRAPPPRVELPRRNWEE